MFLIVGAVAIATVLLATGCAQPDAPERTPLESSHIGQGFTLPFPGGDVYVREFRDASGRSCVLAKYSGYAIALDCGLAPVLRYEELPEQ
jgi:hypothetical protein